MLECPNCKTPCAPKDRYCHQCGLRLPWEENTASGARTQKSLDLVDVHYMLGLVYFKKGQYEKALETWSMALERDPGHQALQERIAEVQGRLQQDPSSGAHPASGNPGTTP